VWENRYLQNASMKVDFSRFHVSKSFHQFGEFVVLSEGLSTEKVATELIFLNIHDLK
jgi:hypothetical protein